MAAAERQTRLAVGGEHPQEVPSVPFEVSLELGKQVRGDPLQEGRRIQGVCHAEALCLLPTSG